MLRPFARSANYVAQNFAPFANLRLLIYFQRPTVQILHNPFPLQRNSQQRRAQRPSNMRTPFAPIQTRKCEPSPQPAHRLQINAQHTERLGPRRPAYFGKSSAGLREKKFTGTNRNSCHIVGITGQSSACGT